MRRLALLWVVCALAVLAGCPPPGQAPAGLEGDQRLSLTQPYLEAVLPADWSLAPADPGQPETLVNASSRQGARVVVTARRLAQALDIVALGQALARVDQDRLRESQGAAVFSPSEAAGVGATPAVSYTYTLAGREHRRILAVAGDWLYTVDLAGPPGAQPALQAVLGSLRLAPPRPAAAPAPAPVPSPAPAAMAGEPAGVRALLDSLDPPRLARARAQLAQARQAAPGDPRLACLEAEAAGLHSLALALGRRPASSQDLGRLTEQARDAAGQRQDDAGAQRALGLVLLAARQAGEAEPALERAVRLDGGDGRNLLAQALWHGYDPPAQERLARRALALAPGLTAARLVLARALAEQGKAQEAQALYQQVLAGDPDHAAALAGLARLEMDDPAGRAQAAARLSRSLRLDPQDTAARFNLALLLRGQGKHQEAERELDQLLSVDPADAAAHNLRGQAQQDQGRLAQAKASFEAAAQADPKYAQAWYSLGALCAGKLSDIPCARAAFKRFLELEPAGPRAERIRQYLNRQGQ